MTRHIFKIIWNERRANAWLLLEYTIVFCILWFCCDYGFSLYRSYYAENGIDIRHTYRVQLSKRADLPEADPYATLLTLKERIKRYPGVEAVAFGCWSLPYGGSYAQEAFVVNSDTALGQKICNTQELHVTSDFFKVFRIEMQQGKIFDENDPKTTVISPLDAKSRLFGCYTDCHEPISEIHTLLPSWGNSPSFALRVTGITKPIRIIRYGSDPISLVFHPLTPERADPTQDIMIRIQPDAEADFAERFTRDMREQFTVGPYFLLSVTPIENEKKSSDEGTFYQMKGVYAVVGFLMVNIFLGLLGSFWFRVQARRSEIGLRVAMGSSKRKVRRMIVSETLLLLSMACVIGTAVCLNLSKTDLVEAIGIPIANRAAWGIGAEQDAINFAATSVFLAIVSVFAVWYPARQASEVPPADVLREE